MKKILIAILSTILFISIMFLPGCGGGNGGGGGNPGGSEKSLKIYQLSGSGGIADIMKELTINSNIAYATGLLEIGTNYILFIGGATPIVESYVQDGTNPDGTPIIVNTRVELTKDFSLTGYNDCFNFNSMQYLPDGKTRTEVIPTIPGKCKLISTAATEGLTKTIEVLVFDGYTTAVPRENGFAVNNTGHVLSGVKSECAFWCLNDTYSTVILPGNAYKFSTGTPEDWRGKLKNMTTVDESAVNAGAPDQILNVGDMYVEKVPGGYVKICRIQGEGIIWEFTDSTSFR